MISTLLAIETSARVGSLALLKDGAVLAEQALDRQIRHASAALPAVRRLLAECGLRFAELDCIAFSRGPGSFTGVRVAATIARIAHDFGSIRVVAAPTLAAIAENFAPQLAVGEILAVLLDAKRGQAYSAAFEPVAAGLRELAPPEVRSPGSWIEQLRAGGSPVRVSGPGLTQHAAACTAAGAQAVAESHWQPRAAAVGRLGWALALAGQFCAAADIAPLYLRPPECEEVFDQRRAEARARREPRA